jgi:ATP-dependent Clp protease ATP-binding subunit ClpA
MFERFTSKAREVVHLATVEADQGGYTYVGTEHLLMAMLARGEGKAYDALTAAGMTVERARTDAARLLGHPGGLGADDAEALQTIGIDLDAVIEHVEQSFGPGALNAPPAGKKKRFGTTRFTKRAKKVLELALREAVRLHHNYIGTEHLLLGLIREGNGLGAKVLVSAGISLSDLRTALVEVVGGDKAA